MWTSFKYAPLVLLLAAAFLDVVHARPAVDPDAVGGAVGGCEFSMEIEGDLLRGWLRLPGWQFNARH